MRSVSARLGFTGPNRFVEGTTLACDVTAPELGALERGKRRRVSEPTLALLPLTARMNNVTTAAQDPLLAALPRIVKELTGTPEATASLAGCLAHFSVVVHRNQK